MRHLFILIPLIFFSASVKAQVSPDSTCYGQAGNDPLDSFYFEKDVPHTLKLVIDTNFHGNIWQAGAVQKTGFPGAFSGTHALQTDTLNSYPVGNESATVVYLDSSWTWGQFDNISSISFWHYFDTDTLLDSCILQVTIDSGKSWNNISNMNLWGWRYYYIGSLNGYSGNGITPLIWSGRSNGWKKETICAQLITVKGMAIPRLSGFRFLFKSDSIETNKPGWMIDNIIVRSPVYSSSVNEKHRDQQLLYPNPSYNGVYRIDYPSQYVTGTLRIYNNFGQLVKTQSLKPTIDLSSIPKGLYYYQIQFDATQQRFSGSMIYQ